MRIKNYFVRFKMSRPLKRKLREQWPHQIHRLQLKTRKIEKSTTTCIARSATKIITNNNNLRISCVRRRMMNDEWPIWRDSEMLSESISEKSTKSEREQGYMAICNDLINYRCPVRPMLSTAHTGQLHAHHASPPSVVEDNSIGVFHFSFIFPSQIQLENVIYLTAARKNK